MDFGERLIHLRESNGIERKELAEKLEIPYTTLRNYEIGTREPGHLFLIKLTKIFNVTVDYLLGLDDEYKEQNTLSKCNGNSSSSEVTAAYETADFDTKNNVRFLLKLPLLKEEIATEISPSIEPRLTAEDERELELIRQEMLAEKRGRTSSASTSAKDA